MFVMGSGAKSSGLRDYLTPPANRTTRNILPIWYKPEMMKETWRFLHKSRYVEPGQLDKEGTAARVAAIHGNTAIVELLQGLGADKGVDFGAGGGFDDDGNDSVGDGY